MYIKIVENGCITAIGTNLIGTEINEAEYNEIMTVIKSAPKAEGKGYKLKEDFTWEEYDLPVPSEDDELDSDEALSILTGGTE